MHVSHDSKSASRISSGAGPNAPQLCCGLCRSDDRRAVRQRQRLPLSLDYLMFIERIPVPTRTPKLWHAMWWEAAATGRHAQSTTQVTTGNAFARLRTCQHRRHELFHLHPILCGLPLARHRSFSILTTQFDRLEPCAVKRPRRAVDAARGTVWTRRGAVTLLTHTLWRWRPFSQLLRPVRVPRMLLRQARGQVPRAVHAERVLHFNRCFVSSFPGTSVLRADPNGFSHR